MKGVDHRYEGAAINLITKMSQPTTTYIQKSLDKYIILYRYLTGNFGELRSEQEYSPKNTENVPFPHK